MAHSGSVHLFVEVRSVSDNRGNALDNINRTESTMLQGLNIPPQPLSEDIHKGMRSTKDLLNSKCPFYPSQPTPPLKSLLHENNYQLHSGLHPGIRGGTCNLVQTYSSENKPFYAKKARFSGHSTAPATPTGLRRSCGPAKEGTQSIVTSYYVEKANIKSVRGQRQVLSQNEGNNPFTRAWDDQAIYIPNSKRFNDAVGWKSVGNSHAKSTFTGSVNQSRCSPNLQRAVVDSIARQATHRALEEFGSPQLRRQFALNTPDRVCDALHRGPLHCHSWSGSPVMPRNARPLHGNAQLMNHNHQRTIPGTPRSSEPDQLTRARHYYHTMSHPINVRSQEIASQKVLSSGDPRRGYRQSPALPTCKPTVIQNEFSASPVAQTPFSQQVSQKTSQSRCQTHKVNVSISCSSKSAPEDARKSLSPQETTTLMQDRESLSSVPSALNSVRSDSQNSTGYSRGTKTFHRTSTGTSTENNFPLTQDYWEQESGHPGVKSAITSFKERTSPTFQARLDPVSPVSHIQDLQSDEPVLSRMNSPVIHHHQPFEYTEDNCLPRLDDRSYHAVGYDSCLRESSDGKDRLSTGLSNNTPDSLIEHCRRGHTLSRKEQDANKKNALQDGDILGTSTKNSPSTKVPAQKETEAQVMGNVEQIAALSQSSSGVTGSLWEVTQPERDSISPNTFSQASQKSNDTGNAATQVKSKSFFQDPSSHYQKIARAKWEFLFGKPSEGQHGVDVSATAPCNGFSSESPQTAILPSKSTSPSSCRPKSPRTSQKNFSHDVQQVDMELVNTPLSSERNTSPRTGIVRRTVKYSETDLDAVPLRCYRETDIDEVLLAEQEEIDSAFSSDNSVLATSGTSRESPLGNGNEQNVDQLHEEEVVSWASVRMHCDRRRQQDQALQDGDDVFMRLLEGPQNGPSDSHAALKSPITVESPIKTSTDGLDSFSRHFESIIESHRAKGTSCSSLDSTETASNCSPIFTFDLPTLTPEIQSQISESAKKIAEMNFASLSYPQTPNPLSPSNSDVSVGGDLNKVFEESEVTGSDSTDNPVLSESDMEMRRGERTSQPVSHTEYEVAQRLALGSIEHNGCKADLQAVKLLAKRLYNLDGFKRSDIAKHLSKNNEFSRMVAVEYLSYFNFSGMNVDQALRVFLREFPLIGETQERERVLSHFSRRYLQCNPSTIPSEDSVHTLTCALMLLNTDLHGNNVGKKMTCVQFISNLEGLHDGQNFPKDLLKALYNSIKNEKLHWTIDEEDVCQSVSEMTDSRTDSASHTLKRVTSGGGPLVSLTQQSKAQVYKNGFLVRKVHADPDGKRTPRGKRGWKSFYAILNGLVLYLQKNEFGANKQLCDEDLKNAVSIHHSLAMKAADYSKRPNVFYLRTADWRVFLFQAPNAEQMQSWITRINTVAAMFSAPPFPAAIGSQRKFSRPLLPASTTKLSQEEQEKSHEMRFRSISAELQEPRSVPQDRKPKGKDQEEAKLREEYLEFEKTRYGTYAMLLRAKLRMGELDLATFEARLFADGALQRANSSPTLPQDDSQASASSSSSASRSKKSSRSEGHRHKPAVKQ